MPPSDAELLLLAQGLSPFDAYDLLADNGFDPHQGAEQKTITTEEINGLLEEHERKTK